MIEAYAPEPLAANPRHGYVQFPTSRALWCAQTPGSNCGPISSEPQSVEAQKGFPQVGGRIPPDGKLASGGIRDFAPLDGITAPNGQQWPAERVRAGALHKFQWYLTAPHRTAKWEYCCTRDGWDPAKPLSRAQLDAEPFLVFDWPCPRGDWTCHKPVNSVVHWGLLPNKTGRHVIYAVWTVADTANAFYQACDVEFTRA